ncbi:hypothetical protein [Pseudomonas sp. NFX15]|uniref:hypothetical protein n=1 Tax=Pseudomonas sp. NFX15 TaxID=2816958 RepID=UPI003B8C4992
MSTTVSKSQARRRLRRLLALAGKGHIFVITKNGKAACLLVKTKADEGGDRKRKGSSRNPGKHRNKNADLVDDVRASKHI